jgi:hypothetical protein
MRQTYLPRPSGIPGSNNPRRIYSTTPIEIDLARSSDQFHCLQIPEPNLLFGDRGCCTDPRTGLALFGPHGAPRHGDVATIPVGIVGTSEGIEAALKLLGELSGPIDQNPDVDCVLYPSFPGTNSQDPFRSCFVTKPERRISVEKSELRSVSELESSSARMLQLQEIFGKHVRTMSRLENPPHVILCAISDSISNLLGIDPASDVSEQGWPVPGSPDANTQKAHRVFRKFQAGLKAACIESLPIELLWSGPKSNECAISDRATHAWNLSLALLRKAGMTSWRLENAGEASCFVGISYFRISQGASANAVGSFAHVLTERGEGFVVQGDPFECNYEEETTSMPAPDEEHARKLLTRALAAFQKYVGFSPRKVTVHKAGPYSEAERTAFAHVLSKVPSHALMTISQSGISCIRPGSKPILRGTAIPFDEKTGLIATSGYAPFLRASVGNGLPQPLAITENWGSISFRQAAEDILRLTKLHLWSSDFCSEFPITVSQNIEIADVLSGLGQKRAPVRDTFYV